MICGRFGPMRKEIVPDIFSLWRDSRRETWSGRRLQAGGGWGALSGIVGSYWQAQRRQR